jgi:hypothetical protein
VLFYPGAVGETVAECQDAAVNGYGINLRTGITATRKPDDKQQAGDYRSEDNQASNRVSTER